MPSQDNLTTIPNSSSSALMGVSNLSQILLETG